MCTCYCSQFGFQPPLKRQGPITILSRLCWFSGSNPCSRCLLSTHLLWQPSDKQWVLKEVSHNQIFPAGQRLKRSFLSPSSGTRAIELAPGIPPLRWAMGQCFAPPCPGPPSFSRHTCTPKPHRGNLLAASATWVARCASWAHLTAPSGVKAHRDQRQSQRASLIELLQLFHRRARRSRRDGGILGRSYESNPCQLVIYGNHLRFAYLKNTLTKTHFQPPIAVSPCSHPASLVHPYPLNLHGTLQKNGIN